MIIGISIVHCFDPDASLFHGRQGSGKLDGAQVTGLKSFEGLDDLDKVLPRSLLIPKIGVRTFSPI